MRAPLVVLVVATACGGGKSVRDTPPAPPPDVTAREVEPAKPAPPAGTPRDDLIPRAVIFGDPERTDVQISPDGKYVSWLAAVDGVLNVWVAPAAKLDAAKPVTFDKTRPVRRYLWAFDNKHLLYLQDKAGDENWHLFRVDLPTGQIKDLVPLDGARVELQGLSPRQPTRIAIGLNDRDPKVFDLYHVDLATGRRVLVAKNDQSFTAWYLDRDLRVRFADKIGEDGSTRIHAPDPASKGWKEVDHVPIEDALTTGNLGFDRTGAAYYTFDSRGRNTAAIYRVDAKSRKKTPLYEDPRVDLNTLVLHPTRFTPQLVQVKYDKPIWVALDHKLDKDLAGITKLFDGVPSIASRTLDDKVWIVSFDSDQKSPRYYRWDRAARAGTLLFASRPALDEQPLVTMHPVVIRSRDGLDLVSYLSLPRAADADADGRVERPVPMVLYVHGGPWTRDEWGYDARHQWLANRGYAVLSVNYRGSTGFGKKLINAANRQWGRKMHDDLIDAVEWATAQGIAPRDRIAIMGRSYGGFSTLVGMTMTPGVFACGVDMVGPSSLVTFMQTIPPYWEPWRAMIYARVGDPRTPAGKQALLDASPLTHAAKIGRPLLLGQGKNDPRVKQSESDQIVATMQKNRIPIAYVVYPDEGHGFARPENLISFFALSEAFLSVHLGGVYQPITVAEIAASSLRIPVGRDHLPGLPPDAAR